MLRNAVKDGLLVFLRVAACNIGGVTLHSFAGVGLAKAPKEELVSNIKQIRNK